MPWCPHCGTEYRTGFTHCADCGTALTCSPPIHTSDSPSGPAEPALLMRAPSYPGAPMILGLLQSEGIACFSLVHDELDGLARIYTGVSLSGEDIYVDAADLNRARELTDVYFNHGADIASDALAAAALEAEPYDFPASDRMSDAPAGLIPPRIKNLLLFLLALALLLPLLLSRLFG